MKRNLKIIIAIFLLVVFIGPAYSVSFGIDDLTPISNYEPFHNGISEYTSDSNRKFSVEFITGELSDDVKNDIFVNDPNNLNYNVSSVGDNIYYFESLYSGQMECGYKEVIKVPTGDYVMITLTHNSKLDDGEKDDYLKDLKEFNEQNKLKTERMFLF